MLLNILKYDVFCHGAAGGAKVAPGPEMSAPVAFTDVGKFLLDLVRGAPLRALHETTYGNARRNRHEEVDMVVGQDPVDDRDAHLATDLAHDLANSLTQGSVQDLKPVFGDPDNMIAMVKNGMRGFIIGHDLSPRTERL